MSEHAKFLPFANRMIEKHGRPIVFKELSNIPLDSEKPWLGSNGVLKTIISTIGCFVPFRGFELGSNFIDEELLKRCDQVLLVAGDVANLDNATLIEDSGVDYKVDWIRRLKPAEVVVLYAFGVTR